MTGKKTKILRVPLTPDELVLVEQLAANERLVRTEFIRELVRKTGREAGLWPPEKANWNLASHNGTEGEDSVSDTPD